MDFFHSQDVAKRNTVKLIALLILAVAVFIIAINILVMVAFENVTLSQIIMLQINWQHFGLIAIAVTLFILVGSMTKTWSLRGGGQKVAEQMRAELIAPGTSDPARQRLLNVVEEMAIASGIPVPPVYVVAGSGINAFAAGTKISNAIIGVSSGAIKQLTREELQGVIGHEISHIINGDMRMNIRIMGLVHGIQFFTVMGVGMLTPDTSRHRRRSSSSNKDGDGAGIGYFVLALGFIVIGYVGTQMANMIKAAVNRQREFLADSAAVQFTRNPQGIGGALIRIGANEYGSVISAPHAAEMSHAYFSQGMRSSLLNLFHTHPPLETRIKRILPTWNGEFEPLTKAQEQEQAKAPEAAEKTEKQTFTKVAATVAGSAVMHGMQVIDQIGQANSKHLERAREVIAQLPEELKMSIQSSYGAQAVIYSLLLDEKAEERDKQLGYLKSAVDDATYATVLQQMEMVTKLEVDYRLPVIDMAMPLLRQLSENQYDQFKQNVQALIMADDKVELFEWTLQKIIVHHLDGVFATDRNKSTNPGLKRLREATSILLAAFFEVCDPQGLDRMELVRTAFKKNQLFDLDVIERHTFNIPDLNEAIDDLNGMKLNHKQLLLTSCASVVMADNHASAEEKELLRAVASSLDCPMPLLLAEEE